VQVNDGIAYIAYYLDGLRVVDLREPDRPHEIGHLDTVPAEQEIGIIRGVLDGTVYISDMFSGTHALQVSLE
jgi:hypothetical protein